MKLQISIHHSCEEDSTAKRVGICIHKSKTWFGIKRSINLIVKVKGYEYQYYCVLTLKNYTFNKIGAKEVHMIHYLSSFIPFKFNIRGQFK